jgi:aminopeptidase N
VYVRFPVRIGLFLPAVTAVFLGAGGSSGTAPASAEPAPELAHRAEIRFDLAAHSVEIRDEVTLPAGLDTLRLGAGFTVTAAVCQTADSLSVLKVLAAAGDSTDLRIVLPAAANRPEGLLVVEYQGVFHQPTEEVVFSRENVGAEITATIGDEGIYLSSAARWLPYHVDALARHILTVDTPAGFEAVTQGVRERREVNGDRLVTVWHAVNPADGINLVAGRYLIGEGRAGSDDQVATYTFLLEDDARLRDLYLERTRYYIGLYEEMIGPYPYGKFATVENWFPTGYGMPSYTLLGGQVLRLPFIPYTSFGHEICHNWWGNCVFVDDAEGNWCEGLTVYCADYHYKRIESDAAAFDYRRNLLKDYAAYVRDEAKDFPLSEFVSRHSGATRAVGYGKSMYVFHMIEQAIGSEAFGRALRDLYAGFQFRPAGWSDFFAAFAAASGRDFAAFREQWIERTGAPTVWFDDVRQSGDEVTFTLVQGAPPYDLPLDVVVRTGNGEITEQIVFDTVRQTFTIHAPGARRVEVDPEHHVFRRLAPTEIEPTLALVLAEEAPIISIPAGEPAQAEAGREFAAAYMTDETYLNVFENGELPVDVAPDLAASAILLNPDAAKLARWHPPDLTVAGDLILISGKRYSLKEYDLVFATRNPHYPELVTDLVVISRSPARLAGLATRITHYGKYSWLLFPVDGGRPERGNWPPGDSPLSVEVGS